MSDGDRESVWEDEEVLGMDGGTTIYLSPSCALKYG